jgi:hypothetical protein
MTGSFVEIRYWNQHVRTLAQQLLHDRCKGLLHTQMSGISTHRDETEMAMALNARDKSIRTAILAVATLLVAGASQATAITYAFSGNNNNSNPVSATAAFVTSMGQISIDITQLIANCQHPTRQSAALRS